MVASGRLALDARLMLSVLSASRGIAIAGHVEASAERAVGGPDERRPQRERANGNQQPWMLDDGSMSHRTGYRLHTHIWWNGSRWFTYHPDDLNLGGADGCGTCAG